MFSVSRRDAHRRRNEHKLTQIAKAYPAGVMLVGHFADIIALVGTPNAPVPAPCLKVTHASILRGPKTFSEVVEFAGEVQKAFASGRTGVFEEGLACDKIRRRDEACFSASFAEVHMCPGSQGTMSEREGMHFFS